MLIHPPFLIAHLKKDLLIVEIDVEFEHVISCKLLNILFVFPDIILNADHLGPAVLVEPCPHSTYLLCPVKLSFVCGLSRDLLLAIETH